MLNKKIYILMFKVRNATIAATFWTTAENSVAAQTAILRTFSTD
ncbi:hypothetical protein DSUL_60090 [Desulfovibrionales bacterium]